MAASASVRQGARALGGAAGLRVQLEAGLAVGGGERGCS